MTNRDPLARSPIGNRRSSRVVVVCLLALLAVTGSLAQSPEEAELERLRSDLEALKEGQAAIQKELAQIKDLLRERPTAPRDGPPPGFVLELGDRPVKGSREARLAVVEFSDYQCPYCARYYRTTYPRLAEEFVETGKILYAMLDFPLSNHPHAFKAAEAAACAERLGKFWEMHDVLFENQNKLHPEALSDHAEAIGLDRERFEACLEAGMSGEVQADLGQARRAGVNATPTFLIGWLREDGTEVEVIQQLRGAQPFANFQRILSQLLAREPDAPDEGD